MTEKLSNSAQRFQTLEENLKVIRENISQAALKSGRDPEEIILLAATKTVPVEVINKGIELGIHYIGENRVQELCDKYSELKLDNCECQFIGHLQTNKVKYLIEKVSMIQSVDSVKLAKEISRLCGQMQKEMKILIEVNIGREPNKSGILPENLEELIHEVSHLPFLKISGLMAIPPADASPKETDDYFLRMKQYFVDISEKKIDNVIMNYLSMGMSADYQQAILAGANMVRIGSLLFGKRIYQK